MSKFLCITAFCLCFMFFLGTNQIAMASDDIELIINNEHFSFKAGEQPPIIKDNRTYVPLRVLSEALDYNVQWHDGTQQVLIATDGAIDFRPHPNPSKELKIIIDDIKLTIDSSLGSPFISNLGRVLIPIRAVGNALDCQVEWQNGVVIVNKETTSTPPPSVQPPTNDTTSKPDINVDDPQFNWNTASQEEILSLSIMGSSIATADQINAYLAAKEPFVRNLLATNYGGKEFIPFPENIGELYIEIGKKYNIRGDIAFAQAVKETGYFQYYGEVKHFQNNYCGLGATGTPITGEEPHNGVDETKAFFIPGLHGITYAKPEYGVEAHIQHLYAYTTSKDLPSTVELLDPRFSYVKRGVAPLWTDLDGRWAVPGVGYGKSILTDYWYPILRY